MDSIGGPDPVYTSTAFAALVTTEQSMLDGPSTDLFRRRLLATLTAGAVAGRPPMMREPAQRPGTPAGTGGASRLRRRTLDSAREGWGKATPLRAPRLWIA